MNNNTHPIPLKTIEVIAAIALLSGIIMKLMYIPFSGPVLVISLGVLAMVYVIRGAERVSFEEDEKQFTVVNMVTGLLLAIACIGILFRLMYWPFSQFHLTIASFGLPIIFGVLYLVKSKLVHKETVRVYFLKLVRVAVFFTMAATLYFTSLKTQIDVENWNDAEMARLKYRYISNQKNVQYKEEYLEYRKSKLNR